MKRAAVLVAAALCAATPASIGLVGNASFSENVPVRVPERAVVLSSDGETPAADQTRLAKSSDDGDHRRRHRGSDDRGSDDRGGPGPTSGPTDNAGPGGGGDGGDDDLADARRDAAEDRADDRRDAAEDRAKARADARERHDDGGGKGDSGSGSGDSGSGGSGHG